jgi:hypothetical protein
MGLRIEPRPLHAAQRVRQQPEAAPPDLGLVEDESSQGGVRDQARRPPRQAVAAGG